MDGTLIDSKIDFIKMKNRTISLLEKVGVKKGLLTNNMLNQEIEEIAKDYLKKNGVSKDEIKNIFIKIDEIMNKVELESIDNIQIYEDVIETLKKINQKGLKIGIITRGCRKYAEKALNKTNLQRYINAIVARDEVSNPKPNTEHPKKLLKILNVKSSNTLLVGDTDTDILCANNFNIKSVWINRKNREIKIKTLKIDYEIKDLTKVLDIIKLN